MRRVTFTDNFIRSTANYNFKVTLPAGSVNKLNTIYIEFPETWERIINYKLPDCTLFNPLNDT